MGSHGHVARLQFAQLHLLFQRLAELPLHVLAQGNVAQVAHDPQRVPISLNDGREHHLCVENRARMVLHRDFQSLWLTGVCNGGEGPFHQRDLLRNHQHSEGLAQGFIWIAPEDPLKGWVHLADGAIRANEDHHVAAAIEDSFGALFGVIQLGGALGDAQFQLCCMALDLLVELGLLDGQRDQVGERAQALDMALVEEARGAAVQVQKADNVAMRLDGYGDVGFDPFCERQMHPTGVLFGMRDQERRSGGQHLL